MSQQLQLIISDVEHLWTSLIVRKLVWTTILLSVYYLLISAIAAKAFGGPGLIHSASAACHSTGRATGGVRLGTGMLALSKEQAEKERRERLRAEMAEREERQREALERKALAHKAKVKAANERRAAVRANAEALAKKQEAEKLKKVVLHL